MTLPNGRGSDAADQSRDRGTPWVRSDSFSYARAIRWYSTSDAAGSNTHNV